MEDTNCAEPVSSGVPTSPEVCIHTAPGKFDFVSVTDDAVLNFYDENQRRRISLGIFPNLGPLISLLDEKNKIISKSP